jgi:hypothetical protein
VAEQDVIPTRYRANTPRRLAAMTGRSGFEAVSVTYVAGLHRYAGRRRAVSAALRALERVLPARFRATIVARYRCA